MPPLDAWNVGVRGEEAVARYLRDRGFRIVHRNLRIGRGEIDIVARKGDLICMVEVKARTSETRGRGLEAVGHRKIRQLRKLGRLLARKEPRARYRWDVASVIWDERGEAVVTYIENAFTETDL